MGPLGIFIRFLYYFNDLVNEVTKEKKNPSAMVGRICPPPGGDRVKVPENLGATAVVPVAPSSKILKNYTNML